MFSCFSEIQKRGHKNWSTNSFFFKLCREVLSFPAILLRARENVSLGFSVFELIFPYIKKSLFFNLISKFFQMKSWANASPKYFQNFIF